MFSYIIKFVNFDLLSKPIAVISNGVTPTVFYWLNILNSDFINPRNLDKKDLSNFKTIILVRYIPFKIFLYLTILKRKSKKIILLLDDNLLDLNIFSELPFFYKLKILSIFTVINISLFFLNEIWVTNKSLKKYRKKFRKVISIC